MERYRIEEMLGRGGMATVYRAYDERLGRQVALKLLAEHLGDDASFRARFLREAKLAARVAHPNVVAVYDAGEDERGLYLVMELVEGDTLAKEIAGGPLTPEAVVDVGRQLCAALEAIHAAGLIHRDMKPHNVLRAPDGTLKLADFGIARAGDMTDLTLQGTVLGSAAYIAPEQAAGGEVTPAADIYGLGVVLYEALTGRRPYDGRTMPELLAQREHQEPAPIGADTPPALAAAIMHCLERDPPRRPSSAAAVAAELAGETTAPTRVLGAQPVTPGAGETTALLPPQPRRSRLPLAVGALVAAAGAVVIALALSGGNSGTPAHTATTPPKPHTAATTAPKTTPATPPTQSQPTASAPTPVPNCDQIKQQRADLDQQKKALDDQKKNVKDKAGKDAIEQQKKALDDRKKTLDQQKPKGC